MLFLNIIQQENTNQSSSVIVQIVFSVVATGIGAVAVKMIQTLLTDIKQQNIKQAQFLDRLTEISLQLREVKDEMKDISIIKTELAKIQLTVENNKEQNSDLKKEVYDTKRDIMTLKDNLLQIKDDIKYIYKDTHNK